TTIETSPAARQPTATERSQNPGAAISATKRSSAATSQTCHSCTRGPPATVWMLQNYCYQTSDVRRQTSEVRRQTSAFSVLGAIFWYHRRPRIPHFGDIPPPRAPVVGFRKVKVACRRSRLLGRPRSWTFDEAVVEVKRMLWGFIRKLTSDV